MELSYKTEEIDLSNLWSGFGLFNFGWEASAFRIPLDVLLTIDCGFWYVY